MLPGTLLAAHGLRDTEPVRYEHALAAIGGSASAESPRALALLGLFEFGRKELPEAAATLEEAATADARIAPFLRMRIAEIDADRGDFARAAAVASRVIAENPGSSAATIAALRLPGLLMKSGAPVEAAAALQRTEAMRIDELNETEFVDLATSLGSDGHSAEAAAILMRLLREYPQGRLTEKVYAQLAASTSAPLDALTYEESLAIAGRLGSSDRYDQEFDLLDRTTRRFPDRVSTDAAFRLTRDRALFSSRRYAELVHDTRDADSPALAILHARAAWRAGQNSEFLDGLDRIEKRWPSSKESAEAKILRAKYYVTDVVDYPRSIVNLERAIAAGAVGTDGEALWNLGWTSVLAGRSDDALRIFDDYVRRYPDADYTSNALFWSGKILDKSGRTAERDVRWDQLIALYPYSYFSYRARELRGVRPAQSAPAASSPDANGAVPVSGRVFPDVEAAIVAAADPRIDTVRELIAIELTRDAAREMKRVAADHPDNDGIELMLAEVYVAGGEPFKANGLLQRRFRDFVRHGGSGIPHRFWEILFPLAYWPDIESAAAHESVDPYLLAAIIRQESGFEPSTVSNAGAVGLMQIMPAEASVIASRAGLGDVTRESLFDPATNIKVGAAEYAQKLASFNGNAFLAVAAYNAGPDAVGRWLAQTPIDDIDLFVEAIPFAETRLYVKTVMRNRLEYRRIYEADSTPAPGP